MAAEIVIRRRMLASRHLYHDGAASLACERGSEVL
jgi:hypothetical protein